MSSADIAGGNDTSPAGKSGKAGLLIGIVLAALAGGGGFFAVSSGMILADDGGKQIETVSNDKAPQAIPDISFVPLEAITVSLAPGAGAEHLRFRGQLEVPKDQVDSVTTLTPRIIDVLNGYLRAVEPSTLEESDILARLRAQMLRRIRLVVGDGRVNDLLIMEFILK